MSKKSNASKSWWYKGVKKAIYTYRNTLLGPKSLLSL